MDAGGIVRLKGLIKNTANTASTSLIANLPAGFRAAEDKMFIVPSSQAGTSGLTRLDISGGGNIVPTVHFSGGGAGFLSLEGITFGINP